MAANQSKQEGVDHGFIDVGDSFMTAPGVTINVVYGETDPDTLVSLDGKETGILNVPCINEIRLDAPMCYTSKSFCPIEDVEITITSYDEYLQKTACPIIEDVNTNHRRKNS